MMNKEQEDELNFLCGGAKEMQEGGSTYIFLPNLTLPANCTPNRVDALLRLSSTTVNDYPTRLFFSQQIAVNPPSKSLNWNAINVVIFQRRWCAFSWGGVINEGRPAEILAQHLSAFR